MEANPSTWPQLLAAHRDTLAELAVHTVGGLVRDEAQMVTQPHEESADTTVPEFGRGQAGRRQWSLRAAASRCAMIAIRPASNVFLYVGTHLCFAPDAAEGQMDKETGARSNQKTAMGAIVRNCLLLGIWLVLCWQTPAWSEACAPTARDSLGPFYVSGTPVVESLNRFGKPGEPMRITGNVRSGDAPYLPLAGAKVELWQVDGRGQYYPEGSGKYSDYDERDIDMRGTVITDDEGAFTVMSLVPVDYGFRPPHVHYRVTAPGYATLVTQHYPDAGGRRDTCRSGPVDRSDEVALFVAPTIYLRPE